MKRILILIVLSLSFLSVTAYGWELYVGNEAANSITVHNQAGQLIDTITDPLINFPTQLAFRANGNLYLALCTTGKTIIIDQNNNVIGYVNTNPAQGLAFGENNHLYLGGAEYDENDNFVKSFPLATVMTVGPNGNLFLVNNGEHKVYEVDLNGNILNQFSTGSGSYPRGIAFGPDGRIYVSRDLFNDIGVYNPNTFALERTITGVTSPYQIAFDPLDNHLFVASFPNNNILEFLYTGQYLGIFTSGLSHPSFITFKSQCTSWEDVIKKYQEYVNCQAP